MSNGEVTELVVRDANSVMADDDIVSIAEVAEKRIMAVKKIISMALKVTSEKDWVNQNGKPYLQGDGAEAVANLFGVSWNFIEKPYKVDEGDGHFRYECVLRLSFKTRSVEVMGARSTKDTFFSQRYKYNKETKQKEPYQLPPSEIDASDVMKSCITNAIANGVTRILGIRNATWDMLKEAGLNVEKIRDDRSVTYKSSETEEDKDLREDIRKMLLDMNDNDGEKARLQLQEVTLYNKKYKSSVKELTEAQLPVIYGKVKKLHEEWAKTHKPKAQPQTASQTTPEDILHEVIAGIADCKTIEHCDALVEYSVKQGIKGEAYTTIIRERDKKVTELKESMKK